MTNDQLDQRVAELLGWDEKSRNGVDYWVAKDGVRQYRADDWSPSTNLTQAMGLWQEHRLKRYELQLNMHNGEWFVGVLDHEQTARASVEIYAQNSGGTIDLPRAVTEAWVEAKEQEGKGK